MSVQRWTWATVLLVLAALAGCGDSDDGGSTGGSNKSDSRTKPSPAESALAQRVLGRGEFPGFEPAGSPSVVTEAGAWASEGDQADPAKQAARLRRLGFAGAALENLAPTGVVAGQVYSLVEQLGSPSSARAELLAEYRTSAASGGGFKPFPVSGIPGARGYDLASQGSAAHNVSFADGRYHYVVGAGYPAGSANTPTRAQVITAARTLYRRVHTLR